MATPDYYWSRRQFGGDYDASLPDSESENYFPEPISREQRLKLPDINGQPTGIHTSSGIGGRRGRLVTFYRNGDRHFKGLNASISQKAFVSMESLLTWLSEKIPTTAGVRHVFRLPDGKPVRDVSEFQPGGHYVVSSVRRLVRGPDYGGGGSVGGGGSGGGGDGSDSQRPWLTEVRDPSVVAGKIRHSDIRLLSRSQDNANHLKHQARQRHNHVAHYQQTSHPSPGSFAAPKGVRLITVVSNTHRSSREKVLVNPNTRLGFEDLLADFASLLVMSGPPVRALYTAAPPYRRVESFSQLFREFKDYDTFIACGRELTPVELIGSNGGRSGDAPDASANARSPGHSVDRQS